MEEGGISRKVLFVLVVLVVAISVLGTWIVLNGANTVKAQPTPHADANVGFTILEPPQQNAATGEVSLTIEGG